MRRPELTKKLKPFTPTVPTRNDLPPFERNHRQDSGLADMRRNLRLRVTSEPLSARSYDLFTLPSVVWRGTRVGLPQAVPDPISLATE